MTNVVEREQRWLGIFMRFEGRMAAYARKRVDDAARASDAVQEWAIKVWRSLDSLHDEENVEGWCYRIMDRVLVDEWRAGKRLVTGEDDGVIAEAAAPVPNRVRTTLRLWFDLQTDEMTSVERDVLRQGAWIESGELTWHDAATLLNERHASALTPDAWRKRFGQLRTRLERRAQRQLQCEDD
jgi:DNA-directed RNA polymerase specialized sigma24 family protein